MEILNTITQCLEQIEKKYDVKILLAVESGSRAWGFPSKNSDWDVRFIYVHPLDWYLKISTERDVIEQAFEGDIDAVGWDLRKALFLLKRSNPSLLEWFHSPIVYYDDKEFMDGIRSIENLYFNPIKSMYHYNRIYNKSNERYLNQKGVPMKKFLYYLRGVLACKWIEEKKTMPPIPFFELVEEMVDDNEIKSKIHHLVQIKSSGKEYDILTVDDTLVKYASKLAEYYNSMVGSFRPDINKTTIDELDKLFCCIVKRNEQI